MLGHDSGPEGLPHSIIVTAEGTEGEAPVLEERPAVQPAQEEFAEVEETAGKPPPQKTPSRKQAKGQAAKTTKAKGKSAKDDQMSLGFDNGREKSKMGNKHGAKKSKK